MEQAKVYCDDSVLFGLRIRVADPKLVFEHWKLTRTGSSLSRQGDREESLLKTKEFGIKGEFDSHLCV
jgi:hypothetical protein